jgi:hypothetical protein
MKRISLPTIIVFVLLPSVANAYYSSRVPLRYRAGYSPYAFSYKYPSGLISGELSYSPYAFSYHHSGLVPYSVQYSPYAFSYKYPSGLVSDYWSGPYYFDYAFSYRQFGAGDCDTRRSGHVSSDESADLLYYQMRQKYEENLKARDERIRTLRSDRQEATATTEIDGAEIIRRYLASKNVDFQMNRILKIGDRMVSAEFLLKNKNLLIKYWNPAEVALVTQDSGYKKNMYEKYRQMCSDFGQQFRQQGGKIYQIESANAQEILEKLKLCDQG